MATMENVKTFPNCYDYGTRFYDAQLARFHVVDRFAEKYYSFSPYNYAANNPAQNIDINGDSIVIWYANPNKDENSPLYLSHTYMPGQKYEGDNPYIQAVYDALNGLLEKDVGTDEINFAANNETTHVNVQIPGGAMSPYGYRPVNDKHELRWDPKQGLLFKTEKGFGIISPAVGLLHELGHFKQNASGGEYDLSLYSWWNFSNKYYDSPEEKRNITQVEAPAMKKLGRPIVRNNHEGS